MAVTERSFREICSRDPRLLVGPFVPPPAGAPIRPFLRDLETFARAGAGILAVTAPAGGADPGAAALELETAASALEACRRACAETGALAAAALPPLDAGGSFSRSYIEDHVRVKGLAAADPDLFWILGSSDLVELRAAAVAVRELWRGPIVASIPGPRDPFRPNPRWAAGAAILAGLKVDIIGLSGEIEAEEWSLLGRIAGQPAAAAAPPGTSLSETVRLAGRAVDLGAGILALGPEIPSQTIGSLSALLGRSRPARADPEPGPWLATQDEAYPLGEGGASIRIALGEGELRDPASIQDLLAEGTHWPLELEAAHPDLLEAALRSYPGRPLVRILAGDRAEREECLYLCARYGAAVMAPLPAADPDAAIAEAAEWAAWAEAYRLLDLRFEPACLETAGALGRNRRAGRIADPYG